MIKIITKNGNVFTWSESKYKYQYDKKAILIFEDRKMVALYNLDAVAALLIEQTEG